MKILNLNEKGKVKFESKKEKDVLVDVFLKKSVEDLKKLGIDDYNFEKIRNDNDWRDYTECKLKVVMGINDGDCFNLELEIFYIKEILDKFFGKKGFDQFYENNDITEEVLNGLFLKKYFKETNEKINNVELVELKQNKINLNELDFLGIINGFIFMAGNREFGGYFNLYIYKYRLPLIDINDNIIYIMNMNDILYMQFRKNIKKNNKEFLKSVSNFLLTKIDLTQDIQEIKID